MGGRRERWIEKEWGIKTWMLGNEGTEEMEEEKRKKGEGRMWRVEYKRNHSRGWCGRSGYECNTHDTHQYTHCMDAYFCFSGVGVIVIEKLGYG